MEESPLFYALRHNLVISDLGIISAKSGKKVRVMFGVYAVKQYFCTRFRERNAVELKY